MKKKGFTLIELLAVIVILAIIALIATPIVMNLIGKARVKSAENSAYGIIKSAENYFATKLLDENDFPDTTFVCGTESAPTACVSETNSEDKLEFKGTIPTEGKIIVTSSGEIQITEDLIINGYKCNYEVGSNNTVKCLGSNSVSQAELLNRAPGLYETGTLKLAKVTVNEEEVDATWENIKLAYPEAFVTAGSIAPNGSNSYLTSLSGDLIIGNDITTIGSNAFSDCASLTNASIPNSVTTIGSFAFYNCTSLESVTIPNSVITIGDGVFSNCTSLESVAIPNSVKTIGEGAFQSCTSLESVTIPNSVTTIRIIAFSNCTSLESVTIPNSVTIIGEYAFSNCTSLTNIEVDSGNANYKSIDGVLFNKTGTTLVLYPAGKTATTYSIPNSVTTIGECAFYKCTSLESVTIPDSVTTIGTYAFYNCTSLTNVAIPNSVTTISYGAFTNVPHITYSGTATETPWGALSIN